MHRLLLILTFACAVLVPGGAARSAPATLPSAEIAGTVVGFDGTTSLIALHTRFGRRSFLLTPTTLILLNNHSATVNSITIGDEARINYQYDTSTANTVHLIRKIRRNGTVGTVTANAVQFQLSRRTFLQLQANSASLVEVEGIPITDRSVLTGVRARAVFEPGSLLLLSLRASSRVSRGRLAAIDPVESTIAISGRRTLVLPVDPLATIRRAGLTATLDELAVDDRVVVAYVRERGALRVLAIEATPTRAD